MRYEINEQNAIRVYVDGQDFPMLFQPDYPDCTPFEDAAAAKAWAEAFIANLTDPENNPEPASGAN